MSIVKPIIRKPVVKNPSVPQTTRMRHNNVIRDATRRYSIMFIAFFTFMMLSYFSMALLAGHELHHGVGGKIDPENSFSWPDPPPHKEVAQVARYVTHTSVWGSLATISTHEDIVGFPFVNVFSISDGPVWNSTGVPYFYLTPLELSVFDLKANRRASLTLSEAQSTYCKRMSYDPQNPRCAHIILSGEIVKVDTNSQEEVFAKHALFSRHLEMTEWPAGHDWFVAKLAISHIYVLDYFGGAKVVDVKEYFEANPFEEQGLKKP